MSAKENLGDYYADTAYTPTKRQQWEEANPERDTIIGSRLSWNHRTQDNGTNEEYGHNNIAISQNWENQRVEKSLEGDDIFSGMKVRYDYQSIMPPNYRFMAKVFFMIMAFGKGFFFMASIFYGFFVLLLLSFTMFGKWSVDESSSAWLSGSAMMLPVMLITFFSWQSCALLNKYRPDVFLGMKKHPMWQLSRQTGLFTIYNPKKAWEKRLEAPFWEYDAFLQSSPDTQGSATYSLILYHPFQQVRQKLDAQFPPTKMPGELVAAWQFLQRYMDVSQPLPDVPGLEIHRHKDPTTAAADQRKSRNPRYWRDMSEAEVEKIQEEKYQKNIRLR